jgi:hypothetical protein
MVGDLAAVWTTDGIATWGNDLALATELGIGRRCTRAPAATVGIFIEDGCMYVFVSMFGALETWLGGDVGV